MDAQSKGAIAARLNSDMDALAGASWTLRQKVALASRILYSEGHWRGLAGQITCRANDLSDTDMVTLGFGVGFDEACASHLSLVDKDRSARRKPDTQSRCSLSLLDL
jgi:L-fuculose-phosphate aldolase